MFPGLRRLSSFSILIRPENRKAAAGLGHQMTCVANFRFEMGNGLTFADESGGAFDAAATHRLEIADLYFDGGTELILLKKRVQGAAHARIGQGVKNSAVNDELRIIELFMDFNAAKAHALVLRFKNKADEIGERMNHRFAPCYLNLSVTTWLRRIMCPARKNLFSILVSIGNTHFYVNGKLIMCPANFEMLY